MLARVLLLPLFPSNDPLIRQFSVLGAEWQALITTLVIIALSGLLYNLSIPVVRWYEGYPWLDTALGKSRVAKYQARLRSLRARWKGIDALRYVLSDSKITDNHQQHQELLTEQVKRLASQVLQEFPTNEASVLPTRLGNVIRSFESYPANQYNMSAIPLFPRLLAVIDQKYAAIIDDANGKFIFMTNCSLLSGVLAFSLALVGLIYPTPLVPIDKWLPLVVEVVLFALGSVLFYHLAIGAALEWGLTIRGTFDLYRFDLLKQLGYRHVPGTLDEERTLWGSISQLLIFGQSLHTPVPAYTSSATTVRGLPEWVGRGLEVARAIDKPRADGTIVVILHVYNPNPTYAARSVVLTDTVPEGFDYVRDSAQVDSPEPGLTVMGTNPYRFKLKGRISRGSVVTIQYEIAPLSRPLLRPVLSARGGKQEE